MELKDVLQGRQERLQQFRKDRKGEECLSCKNCNSEYPDERLRKTRRICPNCGTYLFLPPEERIKMLVDRGSFQPYFANLTSGDPLSFPEYIGKLVKHRGELSQSDAIVGGTAKIAGLKVAIGVLDTRCFMGSMGTVVGEVVTRLAEYAGKHKLPLILFSASGGARMQEGIYSLMQMAKTSAAIERFKANGGFYISVLCNPTTGGVSASFAFLGDIILAEPKALIGFAGPRVIQQTIGQVLPEGFQRAEFCQENGMVDAIVRRKDQKEYITKLLQLHHKRDVKSDHKRHQLLLAQLELDSKIDGVREASMDGLNQNLSAYDRVLKARDKERPHITDYIEKLFPDFIELQGDRLGAEDKAILGGIATFHGIPVTVIGHQKDCNFGMASPEGYRKSIRLMKQAEKFGRPIITFVDTPGAYPGIEAEEHGQAVAIAENLAKFSRAKVPVISIVTGEGGSGGALALAVADQVWMLENAVYSILSPEGFAAILWKDAKQAPQASEVMKLTALDLYEGGIVDKVIPENDRIFEKLDELLELELFDLTHMDKKQLVTKRYERYRRMGRPEE